MTTSHSYATAGTHTVTLTVTDNASATDTATRDVVTTEAPPANPISFVATAMSNANATTHRVTVPPTVQPGDGLLLVVAINTTGTIGTPDGSHGLATAQHGDGRDVGHQGVLEGGGHQRRRRDGHGPPVDDLEGQRRAHRVPGHVCDDARR